MMFRAFAMVRRLGVQRLHALQFLVGQVRQMPYEMHQPPASSILIHVAFRPGRHRSEADAIANDKEQFTVGHRLNLFAAQVRYSWIHVFTDLCLTAAVIGMATGTMVGKMIKPFNQRGWTHRNRIGHVADRLWNGKTAKLAYHGYFKRMRFNPGAEAARIQPISQPERSAQHQETNYSQE